MINVNKKTFSVVLKLCIFATGLSGVVSEYVLSTLASYLLGNSVVQWVLIISFMLFAMGIGSKLSRYIKNNLLEIFIFTEFGISLLCASSAITSYYLSIQNPHVFLVIYGYSIATGILIGLEIPLVTRMNNDYEELRINIANVMEKDYLGALVGGLFFVFFALPNLGLTYTPIILGLVNFFVACVLLFIFGKTIKFKKAVYITLAGVLLTIITLFVAVEPIILYAEQKNYKDTVIFSEQSRYQKIVLTQWREYYWLFINGNEQFSSFDEERYHEPLVHPAMQLLKDKRKVLILGGGDGLALREVLKYDSVEEVVLVDLDPAITDLAKSHPVLTKLNKNSLASKKVTIINTDAYKYLMDNTNFFNLIIVDLPDPKTVELASLYSLEFYSLVQKHLQPNGIIITQSTSPIFSKKAFLCIIETMSKAGFTVLPLHNQIPTLGHWSWVLGVNNVSLEKEKLKEIASKLTFDGIETRFIDNEAVKSMIYFPKSDIQTDEKIQVNSRFDPVIYSYYRQGNWEMY